jgi:hypothetical protein
VGERRGQWPGAMPPGVGGVRSVAAGLRVASSDSLSAFTKWLRKNPVAGDRRYGGSSVQYQVARYCEYLDANPWYGGDPLGDANARDGAVNAYAAYLETFNTPAAMIGLIITNLDHFYLFLGLGRTRP